MVDLCTSGNVKLAAGANVSTAITNAQYISLIDQAEGQLIADTGVDWLVVYATISGNSYGKIVEQAVANFAAVGAIGYDPSGYTTIGEAVTITNICLDRYDRAVVKLKDANVYKPFGGTKIVE